jgi:4-amino-4-deoxy-L-arabinose transferase-like glycosyltransferase
MTTAKPRWERISMSTALDVPVRPSTDAPAKAPVMPYSRSCAPTARPANGARKQYAIDGTFLLLACACLFFVGLGTVGLVDGIDASSSEAAREMVDSGNYLVPQLNFQVNFAKPILFDWLVAGAYQVFGIGEFAARFWSAAFATIMVGAVYALGRALCGRKAGIFAALTLACAPIVVIFAHLSCADVVFASLITVGLLAFVQSVLLGRKRWSAVLYVTVALAVLTSGPAALLYFAASALMYVAMTRPSSVRVSGLIRNMRLGMGVPLFLAVCVPWFCIAGFVTHAEWISAYLRESMPALASSGGKLWSTLVVVLAGMIPSIAFLPDSVITSFKGEFQRAGVEQRHSLAFLSCWILSGLLWLPFVETHSSLAALPLLAPAAVLIGAMLEQWSRCASAQKMPAAWRNACLTVAVAGPVCAMGGAAALLCLIKNVPSSLVVMGLSGLGVFWLGSTLQYGLLRADRVSACVTTLVLTMVAAAGLVAPVGLDIGYRVTQQDLSLLTAEAQQHTGKLVLFKAFSPASMFNLQRPIDCVFDTQKFAADPLRKQPLLVLARQKDADELISTFPRNVQQLDGQGDWRLLLASNMRLENHGKPEHIYGRPAGAIVPLSAGVPPSQSHYHRWL